MISGMLLRAGVAGVALAAVPAHATPAPQSRAGDPAMHEPLIFGFSVPLLGYNGVTAAYRSSAAPQGLSSGGSNCVMRSPTRHERA